MSNKYLKWYWNICERAKSRVKPEGYTEKHHIYPKSIYGQNKYLVHLTAKEHYMVHALLWQGLRQKYGTSNDKTIKMCSAFIIMNSGKGIQKDNRYDSKLYNLLKLARHEKGQTSETKAKISKALKGIKRGPMSDETKAKISLAKAGIPSKMKGIPKSKEQIDKMSSSNKGRVAWNKGIKHTAEHLKHLSEGQNRRYKKLKDENGIIEQEITSNRDIIS